MIATEGEEVQVVSAVPAFEAKACPRSPLGVSPVVRR